MWKQKLCDHLKVHNIGSSNENKENLGEDAILDLNKNTKKTFLCTYCPKMYSRKDHVLNHERSHTDELKNACKYCSQTFWRPDHLSRHESIHKFDYITKFCFCSVCGEQYSVEQLKSHLQ